MMSGILGWVISLSAYGWQVVHQNMAWGCRSGGLNSEFMAQHRDASLILLFFFENLDSPVSTSRVLPAWWLIGFPNLMRHTVAFSCCFDYFCHGNQKRVRISSHLQYANFYLIFLGTELSLAVWNEINHSVAILVFTIAQFLWRQNYTELSHEIGLFWT